MERVMGMGGAEVIIVIVLALIVLVPALIKQAGRHGVRADTALSSSTDTAAPPRPWELPGVRAAVDRGQWRHAIDLYREASGLPHDRAELAVMAMIEPGFHQSEPEDVPGEATDLEDQPDRTPEPDRWPELPERNRDPDA